MIAAANYQDLYALIPSQIDSDGIHLWPFDPTCPVDVRFWSFEHPVSLPLSRHEYMEILFVPSGELRLEVENRELTVNEGDLFVIGSNLLHRVIGYQRNATLAATLYFMPTFICPSGPATESGQYLRPFVYQDAQFPHVITAETDLPTRAFELMLRIKNELHGGRPGARLMVRACLQLLLAELFRYYATRTDVTERRCQAFERIRGAVEYLETHLAEHVTLQEMASQSRMSRSHFVRSFRQATGQSFVSYLLLRRIECAKQLLATTDKSIAEISQGSGFGNQSYFGSVFRELVGMSPKDYRYRFNHRPDELSLPL